MLRMSLHKKYTNKLICSFVRFVSASQYLHCVDAGWVRVVIKKYKNIMINMMLCIFFEALLFLYRVYDGEVFVSIE